MNWRALRYEASAWSCKPFVSWCLIYQWTGHWSASRWLSCVSTIPTLHCFPSGFHCHPQVRADFASRWAVMCGYLIFTLFAPCYIIGNAHHTSEEAFSMSIMYMPKQVQQIWYITTPCKAQGSQIAGMTIPGSNQSLRKVIYMPHWCLIELVGSWSINGPDGLYLQCTLGISILEASFFFLFFIKLSTAATDLRLMQRLIIWYLIF
jgi:hypothetical protein